MRSHIITPLLLSVLLTLGAGVGGAREDIKVERVSFERGKNNAIIESSITGYAVVDYVLGARQGQYMNVSMATNNSANYFNILAPGEDQAAIFNGSIYGNQYEGTLPESGDYKVRVYMMRRLAVPAGEPGHHGLGRGFLPFHGPGIHGVKGQAEPDQVVPQYSRLTVAQFGQLVVILPAPRGLTVPEKIDIAHHLKPPKVRGPF